MKFLAKHEDQRPFLKLYHDKDINVININRALNQDVRLKELQDVVQSLQASKIITHFTHHSNKQDIEAAFNANQQIVQLQLYIQQINTKQATTLKEQETRSQQLLGIQKQMLPLQEKVSLIKQLEQLIRQGLAKNELLVYLDLSDTFMRDDLAIDLAGIFSVNDKIVHLNLAANSLTEKGGLAIANALAQNKSLQYLDLSHNNLTPKVIEALSVSLAANASLSYLNLSHNHQQSQIEASNAICNILENNKILNSLNLTNMNLGSEGLSKILTSLLQYKALRDLNIGANGLDLNSMKQLAELLSSEEVEIKHLNISDNKITNEELSMLADSLKTNNSLQHLELSQIGNMGKEGGKYLAVLLKGNKSLLIIDISKNGLGFLGMQLVAESVKDNQSLSQIKIEGNNLDEAGCIFTAKALEVNNSLNTLDLRGNNVQSTGVIYLAAMLENYNNVKYLNLTSNQIDDSGIEALASVMHNLKALNLSNNQITAKGASFLAEALKEGAALNVLILNNNPLQIEGVLEILSALKNNFALHSLGLKSVSIGDAQVEQIVLILLENIGLARLDLGSNGIYTKGAKHIVTLLKGNTPLSSLDLEGNQLAEDAIAEITKSIPLSNVIALNYALDKSANIRKALSANVNKLQDKLKALEKEDAINLTIQDLYKLYHQILVRKESSAPELSYVNIKDDASYIKQIEAFFKTLKAQKQDGIKEHEEEHQVMELVGEDKFLNALETLDILGIVEIPFDFIY